MCFQKFNLSFLLAFLIVLIKFNPVNGLQNDNTSSVYDYQNVKECKGQEYYDLNYFRCIDCKDENRNFHPSPDRFLCECSYGFATTYDISRKKRSCLPFCKATTNETKLVTTKDLPVELKVTSLCLRSPSKVKSNQNDCKFLYINFTQLNSLEASTSKIYISEKNPNAEEDCNVCNLNYNYLHKRICLMNSFLKPYLHYNSFWLSISTRSKHFGDLKFVAFFCLSLQNSTACNQLANLCVLSFYSLDKNSPCSVFLLTQSSDFMLKYGAFEEKIHGLRPFLFYKKGKQVEYLVTEPIGNFSLSTKTDSEFSYLNFISLIYNLDGSLRRWSKMKLNQMNLCNMLLTSSKQAPKNLKFGQRYQIAKCDLSLETLIDMAYSFGEINFISLFLNVTSSKMPNKLRIQQVPVLVENLLQENQRSRMEEWQLVKRFFLIEGQPRNHYGHHRVPNYEDNFKLSLFHSIRFVERIEIHYNIFSGNRMSIPLVRLRYKHIQIIDNSSLEDSYKFSFQIDFKIQNEGRTKDEIVLEIFLPLLALQAVAKALFQAFKVKNRNAAVDYMEMSALTEFLISFLSSLANVLLLSFLIYASWISIEYWTQSSIQLSLPLFDGNSYIEMLLYGALGLKILYIGIHFWRLSKVDIFFIDWERPKFGDNNQFTFKAQETSSVCSSVKTVVSDNNVSAWRIFFTANEWINLSVKQKTSTILQSFLVLILYKILNIHKISQEDSLLQLFLVIISYILVYMIQLIIRSQILDRIFGNPLHKFIDFCSLANISVLTLIQSCYGFYIHGRSPHGFADTDMTSMILQLQREFQSMCARRGLLNDSDHQTYIILPPKNLRTYFERLLEPFHKSFKQTKIQYQKSISTIESNLERASVAYLSINRFLCAFIDHGIKDMDYIIKEKTFVEEILKSEFNTYLTENKGTFYIDNSLSFGQLGLYGNDFNLLIVQMSMTLSIFWSTSSIMLAITSVSVFTKLVQFGFRKMVRNNVSQKTLIDKRFLI